MLSFRSSTTGNMLYLSILTSVFATNLPFSWDRIPTFAFPGAQDGFITENEILMYNLSTFQQMIIWGFNGTCQAANGTLYPSQTSGNYYSCGSNHSYYPNQEISLQHQGKLLKEMISNNLSILTYIMFDSSQQSYLNQYIFNSAEHANWHLTLDGIGTINCFNKSYSCEYLGPSEYQYDFRQIDVQNYFINNILASITNSSSVNGVFLDLVDLWITRWCNDWHCTDAQKTDLQTAIVDTLENILYTYNKTYQSEKVFSVSIYSNMYKYSDLYFSIRNVLERYKNIVIRYYENFQAGFQTQLFTLMNETRNGCGGLSQHVHVATKTMKPDWVELAAFLIAANNQSWFSYSTGWTLQSHWYQNEYSYTLGKPLNCGSCGTNYTNWKIYNNTNNVFGLVSPKSNSTDDTVIYIGIYNNYTSCFNDIKSSKYGQFDSFTWVNNLGGEYALECFGRFGEIWDPHQQNIAVSGRLGGNLICQRNFEYCDVMLDVTNYAANLNWK